MGPRMRDAAGLLFGLGSVLVGQVVVLAYYFVRRAILKDHEYIQLKPPPQTTLAADLLAHLTRPEPFALVFGYLSFVWLFDLLPESYYDLSGPVQWRLVALQFVVVDYFTYLAHRLEHSWPALYIRSHKSHHKWINPRLYNAFSACVNCNTFAIFGTLYAAQFTLIHCEFPHPWDPLLKLFGIGTAEDHNVHHAYFTL